MATNSGPIKRQRATKACDFCHARGRKCAPKNDEAPDCVTCHDFGVPCTWNRVAKRRGAKPQPGKGLARWTLNDEKHGSRELVQHLIDLYFLQSYPVVNVVFERSFREKWHSDQIPSSQASYALLMAICALSAPRLQTVNEKGRRDSLHVNPDVYLEEALAAIPNETTQMRSTEMMQALGLVCVTALERRMAPLLHKMFGFFHAALAEQGFCDEKQWKPDMTTIEREERRRLFWYMYRLEVHTSLVMGHVVRCPDLQSNVAYPGIPDELLTMSGLEMEWLTGWNFVTDLYRGMEHLITRFRLGRSPQSIDRRMLRTDFISQDHLGHQIMSQLNAAYDSLPDRFKTTTAFSSDVRGDRCGYQTANIVCTMQLVEMLAFTSNEATLLQACQTAHNLIDKISTIHPQFLRAMSLGMLQELSGFGQILSSFIGKDLSKSEYTKLRTVMLCMADLLQNLDGCLPAAGQSAKNLQHHVRDIDHFLQSREDHRVQEQIPLQPPMIPMADQTLSISETDLDPMMMIPPELLQIPWPGEWFGPTDGMDGGIYA
ncbi:putative C6 transcription factor [Elsinoe ampelina]|uniref:Putative C6 transcription factor n=1 Tax=Elsinoe ampelina TaxID=302913 RepID=A0A6A6G179_9PEZI|nr:putative C6 transcription factor [Elsinoe ampelina]